MPIDANGNVERGSLTSKSRDNSKKFVPSFAPVFRGVSRSARRPLPGGHSSVPIWGLIFRMSPWPEVDGGNGRYIGAGVAARVTQRGPS